jgi:V/A-type H+-transporting ATPase subunit E
MSVQLQELIDKIKSEGIKEAEEQAAQIKKRAEDEARQIVSQAKKEAASLLQDAANKNTQLEQSSKEAIKQAARDMVLSLKEEIVAVFDNLLKREIKKALSPDVLKNALLALINNWGKEKAGDAEFVLPAKDAKAVEEYLLSQLSAELKQGLEIKPEPRLEAGFKVLEKDGSAFYDFSLEGIRAYLMEYLNPKVREFIKGS